MGGLGFVKEMSTVSEESHYIALAGLELRRGPPASATTVL